MVLKFQIGSTEADLKRYKKIIKKSKGAKTFTAAEQKAAVEQLGAELG